MKVVGRRMAMTDSPPAAAPPPEISPISISVEFGIGLSYVFNLLAATSAWRLSAFVPPLSLSMSLPLPIPLLFMLPWPQPSLLSKLSGTTTFGTDAYHYTTTGRFKIRPPLRIRRALRIPSYPPCCVFAITYCIVDTVVLFRPTTTSDDSG